MTRYMISRLIVFACVSCACLLPLRAPVSAGSIGGSENTAADLPPLALTEYTPLLVHNQGPQKAEGIVYFIDGLDKDDRSRDDFRATYPVIYEMNRRFGWDVLGAKFPNDQDYTMSSVPQSSQYVLERLAQFKAQGFKKIVLAGQSWGAWVSVDAAVKPGVDKPIDSLLLIAPANYGMKEYDGEPNEYFALNKTEFLQNIRSVAIPTVAVFFRNDEYDPGGRGPMTRQTFARNGVPLLLIDGPEDFEGHGAAWQLRFAALYGGCIDAFVAAQAATTCGVPQKKAFVETALVASEDALLKPDSGAKPAGVADIRGRTLIETTPLGSVSINRILGSRVEITTMDSAYAAAVSSDGDRACIGKICQKLYRLADGGFVSIDDQGDVSSWLVPVD
jgi:pimeloyl-ACP methyl ester carboxylesterase